jgi:hypothetical protein
LLDCVSNGGAGIVEAHCAYVFEFGMASSRKMADVASLETPYIKAILGSS